ncbi:MAG: ATP-binding protein, partial [Prevotellaceae bacterium]|nr:ATP-binding protein [Prevotellaceae bacterium]
MTFKIITIDERLKSQSGVKMIIVGPYGVGKTSLLKTLDEPTLCIDLEAGLLAVQDWQGAAITVRTWPEARNLACLIGGPNPALRSDQA